MPDYVFNDYGTRANRAADAAIARGEAISPRKIAREMFENPTEDQVSMIKSILFTRVYGTDKPVVFDDVVPPTHEQAKNLMGWFKQKHPEFSKWVELQQQKGPQL